MRNVPVSPPTSDALGSVATIVINGMPAPPVIPGEPISAESPAAVNAPLTPTELNTEMVALLTPAELSNVANEGPVGDAPKTTLAFSAPAPSYRFSASPPVLKPMPEP